MAEEERILEENSEESATGPRKLFVNTYEAREEDYRECLRRLKFFMPRYYAFYAFMLLVFCASLARALLRNTPMLYLAPLFAAAVALYFLCKQVFSYRRSLQAAMKSLAACFGDRAPVGTVIFYEGEGILVNRAAFDGETAILPDEISSVLTTKNFYLLITRKNFTYMVKKDAFTLGTREGFVAYLREKGCKVKGD